MIFFGDTTSALHHAKCIIEPGIDPHSYEALHPVLTASPLDYHLFRQEITSKYPAYNPPLPIIPLELDHKSMLPPVPTQTSRAHAAAGIVPGFGFSGINSTGSIFHQPVHIATPAPSPPPSPVGPGGKAGKKQNYQTNQNFPFLYPPLDESSNNIGGRGSTNLQDLMVGKKWEGSDIPASIIEAGELFASRMRMTRAMRQLWKERELFIKHDRGWDGDKMTSEDNSETKGANYGLSGLTGKEAEVDENEKRIQADDDVRRRLDAVEEYFVRPYPGFMCHLLTLS